MTSTRMPSRVAHYSVTHTLGEGGMGVVYAARDERLHREVAVKMLSRRAGDDAARERFWREARAAARVNHPNICQIYEIGEHGGELFIAMELLEGEGLDRRLQRGPMTVAQAVPIALEMLAALSALHARGIVHRDLKPSNVFVTPHGVKLLDFGLAQPQAEASEASDATRLTLPGVIVGTPQYMAPERVLGGRADERGDLFAAGAILFEMLAGRAAFGGRDLAEILHATVHEQPPALAGPPAVAAVDRLIRRALSKQPADRPASADEMAADLRAASTVAGTDQTAVARALTRLVVLPFRALRPDPDSDFLAFSLSDAIATSLSGIGSLVVRSSAAAARFVEGAPDVKALAVEADVDRVVMGTLLRAGDRIRASAQLVEAPGGTLLASPTIDAPMGDLFQLQDDLTRRIVDALALPLGGTPAPDAPHDARAYELYLRANQLARSLDGIEHARELYEQCLALDSRFAPAWAHLGRCHRVIGKYLTPLPDSLEQADHAFRRALAINPRLTVAHKYYAHLEADSGRAAQAVERLLGEAHRHGNDPELFAGLVTACRYCGLFEASLAAHDEARRLDPHVRTSIEETLLLSGRFDRLAAMERSPHATGDADANRVIALGLSGRRDEARGALDDMRRAGHVAVFQMWADYLEAWLDRRLEGMVFDTGKAGAIGVIEDPEAVFQEGWLLCDAGENERGLRRVEYAVNKGYFVAPTLATSPHFDALRGHPAFQAIVARAEAGRQDALRIFQRAGGERLLGLAMAVA